MLKKKSAGILLFRFNNKKLEVLLAHPGGPFWAKKDLNAWSIPKGEFDENEEPLAAALRELDEETGIKVEGDFIELTPVRQKSGKMVYAWAVEGDADTSTMKSNLFEMEWPPGSGKLKSFPEVDKIEWFTIEETHNKIIEGQKPLLSELQNFFEPH